MRKKAVFSILIAAAISCLFLLPAAVMADSEETAKRKVIIDTDCGADDSAALILTGSFPEIDLLGVTALAGNTNIEQAAQNALMALELAGLDVDVYKGVDTNLDGTSIVPGGVFGMDGMGDLDLIHPKKSPKDEDAVDFIIETVRDNPGEVEILMLGPATNIAAAIKRDPAAMQKVKKIWSLGTAGLGPGNATPVAEFNVFIDPDAYKILLSSGIPVTVVGLDMCEKQSMWTNEQYEALSQSGETGDFIAKSLTKLKALYGDNGADGMVVADPVAAMCAFDEGFISDTGTYYGLCMTDSGPVYGMVIFYEKDHIYDTGIYGDFDYNVTLVRECDQENYFNHFLERIKTLG